MEVIIAFVGGQDVFVSLPTGYVKSIIYASLPNNICDQACENRLCERKKLPIFSVFAVS